jgi:hypothetical protein
MLVNALDYPCGQSFELPSGRFCAISGDDQVKPVRAANQRAHRAQKRIRHAGAHLRAI